MHDEVTFVSLSHRLSQQRDGIFWFFVHHPARFRRIADYGHQSALIGHCSIFLTEVPMDILTAEEMAELRIYDAGLDTTGKTRPKGVDSAGLERMGREALWITEAKATGDTTLLLMRWRKSVHERISFGKKPYYVLIPLAISRAIGRDHQVHAVLAKDGTLTTVRKEHGKPKQLVEVLLGAFE